MADNAAAAEAVAEVTQGMTGLTTEESSADAKPLTAAEKKRLKKKRQKARKAAEARAKKEAEREASAAAGAPAPAETAADGGECRRRVLSGSRGAWFTDVLNARFVTTEAAEGGKKKKKRRRRKKKGQGEGGKKEEEKQDFGRAFGVVAPFAAKLHVLTWALACNVQPRAQWPRADSWMAILTTTRSTVKPNHQRSRCVVRGSADNWSDSD